MESLHGLRGGFDFRFEKDKYTGERGVEMEV
jgi:hypothetical protein